MPFSREGFLRNIRLHDNFPQNHYGSGEVLYYKARKKIITKLRYFHFSPYLVIICGKLWHSGESRVSFFFRWVKEQGEVTVIYLTARDMEEDALAGYESGAEEYVTKPFSMKTLLRKIEIILKRTATVNRLIFSASYLYIDLDNARVTLKGEECAVTPTGWMKNWKTAFGEEQEPSWQKQNRYFRKKRRTVFGKKNGSRE